MVSIEIKNLDKIQEAFKKAPEEAKTYFEILLDAIVATLSKNTIRGVVPYDTGTMMNTFEWSKQTLKRYYFPTRHYAPYVYYGTSRGIKANPYMERIADRSQSEIDKHIEDTANILIHKIIDK